MNRVDSSTKIGEIKAPCLAFSVMLLHKNALQHDRQRGLSPADQQIAEIELWISNYPRKLLNYETANQQYLKIS